MTTKSFNFLSKFVVDYIFPAIPKIYGGFTKDKQTIIGDISSELYESLDKYYNTTKGKIEFEIALEGELDGNRPYNIEYHDNCKKFHACAGESEYILNKILSKYLIIYENRNNDYEDQYDDLNKVDGVQTVEEKLVLAFLSDCYENNGNKTCFENMACGKLAKDFLVRFDEEYKTKQNNIN